MFLNTANLSNDSVRWTSKYLGSVHFRLTGEAVVDDSWEADVFVWPGKEGEGRGLRRAFKSSEEGGAR